MLLTASYNPRDGIGNDIGASNVYYEVRPLLMNEFFPINI